MHSNCSLYVDRSKSGDTLHEAPFFTSLREVPTEYDCVNEQLISLELILDHNSVEAFFFDWYSITSLVFTEKENNGIEIFTDMNENYIRILSAHVEILEKTMLPHDIKNTEKSFSTTEL